MAPPQNPTEKKTEAEEQTRLARAWDSFRQQNKGWKIDDDRRHIQPDGSVFIWASDFNVGRRLPNNHAEIRYDASGGDLMHYLYQDGLAEKLEAYQIPVVMQYFPDKEKVIATLSTYSRLAPVIIGKKLAALITKLRSSQD